MLSRERLKEIILSRHEASMAGTDEVSEMAREVLASRWRPITETDLPKDGDELWAGVHGCMPFSRFAAEDFPPLYDQLRVCCWTHFRSNGTPPARADKGEA